MPSVRVMAWNVQNFGSVGPSSARVKGVNSSNLARFIAAVVNAYQIDVLALMEVQQAARPSLDNTLHALNAATGINRWCYDWIQAALEVTGQPAVEASVTTNADLSWASGQLAPRREGYAVFWRNEEARFRMLRAQRDISLGTRLSAAYHPVYVPNHALSLNLAARQTQPTNSGIRFAPTHPYDETQPAQHWEPAFYPEVGIGLNLYSTYWELVRRPAVFMLQLNVPGGDQQRVWPIQVFHAPSQAPLARRGIVMAALGQENYSIRALAANKPTGALLYHDRAGAAGDYNLNPDGQNAGPWFNTYSYWWETFPNDGAEMEYVLNEWNDSRPTEVSLVNWNNGAPDPTDPILGPNTADYYGRPIDNVMVRGINGALDSPRLLEAVMTGGALAGAPVTQYLPRLVALENLPGVVINANRGPTLNGNRLIPEIRNYNRFRAGVVQGFFDGAAWNAGTGGARSAAQFIRTFVSDHLPVTTRVDW